MHERLAIYKKPYFLYTFCGPATENRGQAAAVQSTGKGPFDFAIARRNRQSRPAKVFTHRGPNVIFTENLQGYTGGQNRLKDRPGWHTAGPQ